MRISPINKPLLFITMGDPSGIGPEIVAKSMASPLVKGLAIFMVIGDSGIMKKAIDSSPTLRCQMNVIHPGDDIEKELSSDEDIINVFDPSSPLKKTLPGNPTEEGVIKTLKCLETAVGLMKTYKELPHALVTAPLSKERIATIEKGFVGHTEYLQEAFSSKFVTMVMKGETLCVIPVTRHIAVKDIAVSLTREVIEMTLMQIVDNLSFLCDKKNAKIGVTGLNPHCGEGGKIGDEEGRMILPAIKNVSSSYPNIEGPIAADVVFGKALKKEIDIVVSMYHDQGLGPFKTIDFDTGVNVTLGLGHVRTSPDHGTAFDIAGKGMASSGSMEAAIKLAVKGAYGSKGS